MFKRLLRFFLILFGLTALGLSSSESWMKYVAEKRDNNDWWGYNQKKGGNLSGIADLGFLKKFNAEMPENIRHAVHDGTERTVLYLYGDSYTWSLRDTNFAAIAGFHFICRYDGGRYCLDTAMKNILVIEVSEISLRRYFRNLRIFDDLCDSSHQGQPVAFSPADGNKQAQMTASFFPSFLTNALFNKNTNQNLQGNLFNYNVIVPVFQYKAAFNYYIFGRASGNVVLSKDKNFLFYKPSVSWVDTEGAYCPLLPGESSRLVSCFNEIYDHYKAEGFAEVYLSLIPHTASLMQPEGYNNLIPAIQDDKMLRMKIIDVYYAFKKSPHILFHRGDSHWNPEGKQKWVNMINQILINVNNDI